MSFVSGPFAPHAQQVLQEDRAYRPKNTQKCYASRVEEFLEFCHAKYPCPGSGAEHPATVTEEKLFGFLHYQCRRPIRPRRKRSSYKKYRNDAHDDESLFNVEEYEFYMRPENVNFCAHKPVGYSVINHYMSAILDLHQQQVDNGCNNITKEQLRSNRVKKLLANVKIRKTVIAKENFEERLTGEFAPYTSVSEIPRLEFGLFSRNSNSSLRSLPSLRDRYALLQTISGILRGESLIRADLSDLCDLMHKPSSQAFPIHIVVMRIAQGKTNANRILYGRSIRHRDVNLCAVGALALYLFARFSHSHEMDDVDFTSNRCWFNIKLLTDCSATKNTTAISERTYYKSIKKLCTQLSIPAKHYIHFGRTSGSVVAELEELDGSFIQDLGNWNVDTRRDVYSAKLPMKAMRVMAGHDDQKGSVFVARSLLAPPESLQLQIFPFIEHALHSIEQVQWNCSTAYCFLQLLKRLRVVILQDAAEMLVKERQHIIFSSEVFQSEEFHRYVQEMQLHLSHSRNPHDASLQSLLPGIHQRFDHLHADFSAKFTTLNGVFEAAHSRSTAQLQHILHEIGSIDVDALDGAAVEGSSTGGKTFASKENTNYSLFKHHKSFHSIFHEWYGTNAFDSNQNPNCYKGGIQQLENDYGHAWRSHFTPAEQKHFSRLKLTVMNINKLIESKCSTAEAVLVELDDHAKENRAQTVSSLEKLIKEYLKNSM